MPRRSRVAPGGMVFHVLNRAVGRARIFNSPSDYAAFESILEETQRICPMRICAYCLMPNHWHLVLWPKLDGELAAFMQRLTVTHVMRWQQHRQLVGSGHLYQGRFKSFPVESDDHFYHVARYVERNAVRTRMVNRAESWRWSSVWRRQSGTAEQQSLLCAWPLPIPDGWLLLLNQPQTESSVESIRDCICRGRPYGSTNWMKDVARGLGLTSTMRSRGRPRSEKHG